MKIPKKKKWGGGFEGGRGRVERGGGSGWM